MAKTSCKIFLEGMGNMSLNVAVKEKMRIHFQAQPGLLLPRNKRPFQHRQLINKVFSLNVENIAHVV